MNAEFQWWLLILGAVIGGSLVYLVLADLGSDEPTDDPLDDEPLRDEPPGGRPPSASWTLPDRSDQERDGTQREPPNPHLD